MQMKVNSIFFIEDSVNVVFSCDEIVILNIVLNDINLDNNFNEEDLDTSILIRLLE